MRARAKNHVHSRRSRIDFEPARRVGEESMIREVRS
jgi:hypothetical protein